MDDQQRQAWERADKAAQRAERVANFAWKATIATFVVGAVVFLVIIGVFVALYFAIT